jgi:glycosyltransferase involved in cell wall biosynthesis
MIKICHLISSCLTNHGPNNVLIPIVRRSAPQRYRFAVWSLNLPPQDRDPGAILHEAGADYRVFTMAASFLDVRIVAPLVRQLKSFRPDILHCHLVRANLYGRIAARLAGAPVVICTHHGIEDYMVSDSLRDRAVRSVERLTDNLVTCHVGVSESMRRAAIRHLGIAPDKIVAIPNGVDLTLYNHNRENRAIVRQELGLAPDAVVVGSVGILNQTKNFKQMVRIAKSVVVRHPEVQFVIIGEGDQRPELEAMVAELGLRRSVILPGFRRDIPRVLMALDIFALTSRSEGFGLAVVEAMASGLPCVVFDVGALGELVADGQTGLLVKAGDVESFGQGLIRLITNPELRSDMGQAALARTQALFSIELMVQRYNELYDRLVAMFS